MLRSCHKTILPYQIWFVLFQINHNKPAGSLATSTVTMDLEHPIQLILWDDNRNGSRGHEQKNMEPWTGRREGAVGRVIVKH